jgi:RNA polymerase sigma-70 factor, ECF subfamily
MIDEAFERVRQGSGAAFAALVEQHCHAVYRIAGNMCTTSSDAEEVTRQTFLSAYRDADSCPIGASLTTWLYGIAMKTALSRAARPRLASSLEPFLPRFDVDGRLAQAAGEWPDLAGRGRERIDVTGLLREALDCIEDGVRAAFVLCDLVEMPAQEAAAILQTSPEMVRQRVHRARLMIRGFLDRVFSG